MQQDTDTSIPDIPDVGSESPTGAMVPGRIMPQRTPQPVGKPWEKYSQKVEADEHTVGGDVKKDVRSDDQGWLTDAISGVQMFGTSLAHGFQEQNPIDPKPTPGSKYDPKSPEYQQWEQAYRAKAQDRSALTTDIPEFIGQSLAGGPAGVGVLGGRVTATARAADEARIAAGVGSPGLRGNRLSRGVESLLGRFPGGGDIRTAAEARATVLTREAEEFAARLAGESAPEMAANAQSFRTPLQRAGQTLERGAILERIANPESRQQVQTALEQAGGPRNVFRVLVTSTRNPVAARQLIYPLVHSLGGVRNTRLLAGAMIDELGRTTVSEGTGRLTRGEWNVATFLENYSNVDRTVAGRLFGRDALGGAELGPDLSTTWRQIVERLQTMQKYRHLIERGAEDPEYLGPHLLRGAKRYGGWASEGALALYGIVTGHTGIAVGAVVTPAVMKATGFALTHPRTAAVLLAELTRATSFATGTQGVKKAEAFMGFGDAGAVSDMPSTAPDQPRGTTPRPPQPMPDEEAPLDEVAVTGKKQKTDIRPE